MKTRLRFATLTLVMAAAYLLFPAFSSPVDDRAATPGTVTFTVATKPAGGNYSPKHVLAIWIEKNGEFVKTRKAMANQRKQYLYTWKASSNYNVVDAITGPTLNSHQTHSVEWDCTGLDGNVVEDGTYTMLIEFTDKHAQGPLYSIDFEKGTEQVVINPPNQSYFTDMELIFEPEIVVLADFTADITQACTGDEIVFTDNSTGATSWQWDFGEGAVPATAAAQGPHNVTYTSAGNKTVSLTINASVNQTKADYIEISPDAVAGFSFQQISRTVEFNNSSLNAIAYLWDFGDGNTSSETDPVHTYADDGTYTVELVAESENCGSDIFQDVVVINTVGIVEEQAASGMEIYPNPSGGTLMISLSKQKVYDVFVMDIRGNEVYATNGENVHANGWITLQLSDLTPGLYFIRVTATGFEETGKLVIR